MRRIIAFMLTLLLALPCAGALAESGTAYQTIRCPEQGFSTQAPAACDWYFVPDGGLIISLEPGNDMAWLSVNWTDDAPSFNAEGYLENVFTAQMVSELGDDLLEVSAYSDYDSGEVTLWGMCYAYQKQGDAWMCLCMFDFVDNGFVRYELRFSETEGQRALAMLNAASNGFRPDPDYYDKNPGPTSGPETQRMAVITCPEQDFCTLSSHAVDAAWVDGEGLYLYISDYNIPHALIYVMQDPPEDLSAYIDDALTPYMQQQYGRDLLAVQELGTITLGGREVVAAQYTYRASGYILEMLRAYDQRDGRTLIYTAKYIQGEGDEIVATLDEAVEWYRPDAAYYNDQMTPVDNPPEAEPQPEPEPAPEPVPEDEGLVRVDCPELGFTTACAPGYAWEYQEGSGINIYTQTAGSIPYVLVFKSSDLLGEPYEYLREQYTPYMRGQYGDDLVDAVEYESVQLGGKLLPAAVYTYRLQGYVIEMVRVMDSTGAHTVSYTAKYVQGEGAETLAALDAAIRWFREE